MSAFTLVEGDVTLRSGGIETATADGVPLPVGTRGYVAVGFDVSSTRFMRVDGSGRQIIVGPDAPGAAATGNPVVAAGVDIGGFVRPIFTDSAGRQRFVGAADNATPVTGAPVLVGGSDGTNVYRLLTDTAGRLQVNVVGGGGGGTSSSFAAAFPVSGTAAGFYDGANMQGARVHDLDTTGGTEFNIGVSLRLPGAGGSVLGGTLSDPIRTDPTGTTTQPTALVSWLGSVAPTVGQKTSVASIPVVLASDQSTINVNASNPSVGTNNLAIPASSTLIGGSDGTNLRPLRTLTDGTQVIRYKELPSFTMLASSVVLGNNKSLLSVVNAGGSSVALRILSLYLVNVQTTSVSGVIGNFEIRRITGHSVGTDITATVETLDTADSLNGSVTARTGATVAGESSKLLWRTLFSTDEWVSGNEDVESTDHDFQVMFPIWVRKDPDSKPLVLRAGEGFTVKFATNSTNGTFDIMAVVAQE